MKGTFDLSRTSILNSKRSQPDALPVATNSTDEFSYLEGSKDIDNIKAIIQQAALIDHSKVELKEICLGVSSNQV